MRPGGGGRPPRRRADASPSVIPLGERSRSDDLSAAEVAARHAPPYAGDDLVVDRPARLGELFRGLMRPGLRADQGDLVALAHSVDVRHIEHREVHADAAGERNALSADEDRRALAGDARQTI